MNVHCTINGELNASIEIPKEKPTSVLGASARFSQLENRTIIKMKTQTAKVAFSVVNGIAATPAQQLRTSFPAICRSNPIHLNQSIKNVWSRQHCIQAIAVPAPSSFSFDKVPKKLPDWWNEEDEEEDEAAKIFSSSNDDGSTAKVEGGGGGDAGGAGGEGNGDGDGKGGGGNNDDNDGFFNTLLVMYTHALLKYPIPTKAISTSILAICGDFIAQRLSFDSTATNKFQLDFKRSAGIGLWGLAFMGPVLHTWYSILDRMVSTGRFLVLKKVAIDQIFFAPFFNSAFMFGTGMLEGRSFNAVAQTWKNKFKDSMFANWMLWPFAQAINFSFIPKPYQVMFVNCVALLWNAILTYISHDDLEHDDQGKKTNLASRGKNSIVSLNRFE